MLTQQIFLTPDHKAWLTALLFDTPLNTNINLPSERRPAVLIAPGGGYSHCSRREAAPVSLHFSMQGYQCFALEYHCGSESDYPIPLVDIALALSHIRTHAEQYDINPYQIALVGFSAGGHLCALLASLWYTPELSQLTGLAPELLQPNALILAYPVANLKAMIEITEASPEPTDRFGAMLQSYSPAKDPMRLVSNRIPPVFLFTTRQDDVIPADHTFAYARLLQESGVSLEFHQFSEGAHGLGSADGLSNHGRVYPKRLGAWLDLAIAWLNSLFEHSI